MLSNQKGVKEADRLVAKYGCDYTQLTQSKPTGNGWAGCIRSEPASAAVRDGADPEWAAHYMPAV